MILHKMAKIKKAYYYIFYRLYLMFETTFIVGDSDWKASTIMTMLEISLYFSMFGYYKVFIDCNVTLPKYSPILLVPMAVIFLSKYYAFFRDEAWKKYNKIFERWPNEKHVLWGRWVLVYILFVIIAFASADYLLYKQAVELNKWY